MIDGSAHLGGSLQFEWDYTEVVLALLNVKQIAALRKEMLDVFIGRFQTTKTLANWEEEYRRTMLLDILHPPGDQYAVLNEPRRRIGDYDEDMEINPAIPAFFDAVADESLLDEHIGERSKLIIDREIGGESVARMAWQLQDCRMSYSPKRQLCIIPREAKYGDAVYILDGCSIPLVLRGGPTRWQIVGGAYVHGIMDGLQPGEPVPTERPYPNGGDSREEIWLV